MPLDDGRRVATLYRMAIPGGHLCPLGLKSRALLMREGYAVEDHPLETREEVDSFQQRHGVETTPQAWIDGQRIGGYAELRAHFGRPLKGGGETSHRPVIAIFGVALGIALAIGWVAEGRVGAPRTPEWFVATAMVLLGLQKLQDVESFSTTFLNYDLLAQRWLRYANLYPWAETLAGLAMLAGVLVWIAAPVALVIGTVGLVSVYKAVYLDRRTLRCACAGGGSTVPLGAVSLTENLLMKGMGLWMIAKALFL